VFEQGQQRALAVVQRDEVEKSNTRGSASSRSSVLTKPPPSTVTMAGGRP
jgi:hypothetical protein